MAVLSMAMPAMVSADSLRLSSKGGGSVKSRLDLFKSQTQVLDGRAAQQYRDSVRFQPKSDLETISINRKFGYSGKYRGKYLPMAKAAAKKHGVPEDLFARLVQQESGFNPGALSVKGAMGLAQLMPQTAALLGVDPTDPKDNLEGGARYLKMMYARYGDWKLALAAYNAGPDAVDKHSGVPPYKETMNYVKVIWGG